MPTELMKDFYQNNDPSAYIHMTMAIHCAPFLKGIRDTSLLVMKPEDAKMMGRTLAKMNAKCRTLYRDGKKMILFVYREAGLNKMLHDPEVEAFLLSFGYGKIYDEGPRYFLNDILKRLKERYLVSYGIHGEFPHEIGAFLGYPIEDVIGFIENQGKNFLLSRYWKVYSNQSEAEKTFRVYDEARDMAIHEVLAGKKFYEIAM